MQRVGSSVHRDVWGAHPEGKPAAFRSSTGFPLIFHFLTYILGQGRRTTNWGPNPIYLKAQVVVFTPLKGNGLFLKQTVSDGDLHSLKV